MIMEQIHEIKLLKLVGFQMMGMGEDERIYLPTNLSKMLDSIWLIFFLLMTMFLHTII